MIDQIKNKAINTVVTNSKNNNDNTNIAKTKVQKVENPKQTKVDAYDGKVSQFISRRRLRVCLRNHQLIRLQLRELKRQLKMEITHLI